MTFKEQQANWEGLAETDPLWSVLSEPEKRGGKWDPEEFYRSGQEEADDVRKMLGTLGLEDRLFGQTLDVGCGPGRVSHALAGFGSVTGYDISPRMLELAEEGNEEERQLTFVLNETDDLSPFGDRSFDFVYCSKVLQHVDAERVGDYLGEMVRVLKSQGVLWVQMLSHPTGWPGTKDSAPDLSWGKNGQVPHYSVCSASIDYMMGAFLEMKLIIHQARLVEKGEGQSIFSYDYVTQRR